MVLGPFATQYLGDFGADVIKVEPPGGDIFRHVQPSRSRGMGAGHLAFNRNKRAIGLNLKQPEDRARLTALLEAADVLVHNMRPAAAKRLGLDPESLREAYPRLVYCVSTGYGSRGRFADRPAYDDIIQAASGIAHLNADSSGNPRFLPTILCDKIGGLHLAMAVLAGVVRQTKTGKGCVVEAPMFEGLVSFLLAEHLAGERFRPAKGSMGYNRIISEHRRPYATRDGYVAVLPYDGRHWMRFLEAIGRHELARADWVQDAAQRSERVGELYAVIARVMPERTTADWISLLHDLDIPCTAVNSLDDLLSDAHLADVGLFQDIEHPSEGSLRAIRTPFWVEGAEDLPDDPAPDLLPSDADVAWAER
ncbi:CaiB/BaiF CoA transferase family protein [Hoeflea poritis]|uniref:CoA transferase n=1 Tax=Hoeflea poritis TaxID=2993659 RepID=A0ABT4VUQ4_9HYPH|nr:CoA transferase [Hoeflea poritis]MDA4848447.1 CoA transferase [Hoeflea poritis]